MSAALTLAGPEHLERLVTLVTAYHDEAGIWMSDESRRNGIAPLLDGIPHGAAYLIGPPRAAIGYVVISFGWSLEFGGLDATIDELYIRPGVRGRGVASEALVALPRVLAQGGLCAIHIEVDRNDHSVVTLYQRMGFKPREGFMSMALRL